MLDYFALLEKEEEFRLKEQSALINSLLTGSGSASKGKLSLLRRAGLAMTGLEVVGKRSGTGGRIIIEFKGFCIKESSTKEASNKSNKKQGQSNESQSNQSPVCFKPGDLVKLIIGGNLLLECTGTVERSPKDIDVSVSINGDSDELDEVMTSKIALVKIVDDVGMFGKMKGNLEMILKSDMDKGELQKFMKQFIENIGKSEEESLHEAASNLSTSNLTSRLNAEQELAVSRCLEMLSSSQSTQSHVLIHGPPGTGKTSVLVELIRRLRQSQQNKRALRILVCGPSNLSVDNVLERLQTNSAFDQKVIRIGHPSRVLETCQKNTLDFWCENCDSGLLLKDVQKEIDAILKVQLPRCKSREERRGAFAELKELRRERREREKKLQINLIDEAEIVFCTLGTACGRKLLTNSKRKFDLAIVDEAGQALLPEILIAPILSDKLILAGDHFQLPPTVMNPEIKETLQVSLFEHLILKGAAIMLKEQYRMNGLIMKWSNSKFYGNQLRAAGSVADWKIADQDVLVFYDTCGFDLWESNEEIKGGILIEESSKYNAGEAKIALDHFKSLVDSGVPSDSIAIISPYSAQVSLLRELITEQEEMILPSQPEINSIDAFQGREKDVAILSLVRSNPDGVVGFLGEMRRINVAMTRAKKQLVIIGDSETLSRDTELKELVRIKGMKCTYTNTYFNTVD